MLSYPVRETLSVLKSIYQEAGVRLALPDRPGDEQERGNRRTLRELIEGLDVHWSPDAGERWRDTLRRAQLRGRLSGALPADAELDSEGLVTAHPNAQTNRAVALPFSVFHHMPTPKGPLPRARVGRRPTGTRSSTSIRRSPR